MSDRIPTCDCGHPQGWHRKNVGSCIECACPFFDDRDEAATDRAAEARSAAYTVEDLAASARSVAMLTAALLIREQGDADAAIELAAEFSLPVEGDEVLDAAGIAALAIRDALNMGVEPRV